MKASLPGLKEAKDRGTLSVLGWTLKGRGEGEGVVCTRRGSNFCHFVALAAH